LLDNLVFSLNAIAPIFLLVLLGYAIKRRGHLDEYTYKKINTIVFKFAMPVMLFRDVLGANLREAMDLTLIVYMLVTTFLAFFGAWIFAILITKDRRKIGAFVQGSFRGNFVFIGLPLIRNIMGGELPARALVVTAFIVPTYNILSVVILTIYSGEKQSLLKTTKETVLNIVKNPLIWGIFLGVGANLINLELPIAIAQTFAPLSQMAMPIMLLCIGATLDFTKLKSTIKNALLVSFYKLVLVPLVFLSIAIYMGFPSDSIVVLYVMYAAPTAIASYTMAAMMNSDEELASNIVVLTSLLSAITFTIGIYILRVMEII